MLNIFNFIQIIQSKHHWLRNYFLLFFFLFKFKFQFIFRWSFSCLQNEFIIRSFFNFRFNFFLFFQNVSHFNFFLILSILIIFWSFSNILFHIDRKRSFWREFFHYMLIIFYSMNYFFIFYTCIYLFFLWNYCCIYS